MLLKSTGSEVRWSGFKTTALSLLEGLLWESYLTVLCLNFVVSFTWMTIYPISRLTVKIGKDSVCETLRTVPSMISAPFISSVCVCVCVCVYVVQSCPTHCGPMDCRLLCPWNFPGKHTAVGCHFLLQGSSRPTDQICVSSVSCVGSGFSNTSATWGAHSYSLVIPSLWWLLATYYVLSIGIDQQSGFLVG